MEELRTLAHELSLLREDLENLKREINSRDFIPPFYRRSIFAIIILSFFSLAISSMVYMELRTVNLTLNSWFYEEDTSEIIGDPAK